MADRPTMFETKRRILEGMRRAPRHVNEITGRDVQPFIAHLHGQRPLLHIERFILTRVNVRRRTSSRRDTDLGHKERPACLGAGD